MVSRRLVCVFAFVLLQCTCGDQSVHDPGTNESVSLLQQNCSQPHPEKDAQLTRIIAVGDTIRPEKLCSIIEFRLQIKVFYTDRQNKTKCRLFSPNLRSPTSDDSTDMLAIVPPTTPESVKGGADRNEDDAIAPSVIRHVTTPLDCCTQTIRCFSISFTVDSADGGSDAEDEPSRDRWRLSFTWRRIPESYEFGEEGWSSVGAPLNSLSGIYNLVNVSLEYQLTKASGFNDLEAEDTSIQSAKSTVDERFQARVGDYYVCNSATLIWLATPGTQGGWPPPSGAGMNQTGGQTRLLLILTDLKSQAFSDANIPTFFGASFVCPDDTPYDRTLSIVIGLSICALIVLILMGLAISHLRDKDRSFKIIENQKDF